VKLAEFADLVPEIKLSLTVDPSQLTLSVKL
jgi:hypothetical protein